MLVGTYIIAKSNENKKQVKYQFEVSSKFNNYRLKPVDCLMTRTRAYYLNCSILGKAWLQNEGMVEDALK